MDDAHDPQKKPVADGLWMFSIIAFATALTDIFLFIPAQEGGRPFFWLITLTAAGLLAAIITFRYAGRLANPQQQYIRCLAGIGLAVHVMLISHAGFGAFVFYAMSQGARSCPGKWCMKLALSSALRLEQ